MYEMLLIWFFCVVFFATGNIALILTRKPSKNEDRGHSEDNGHFCPKCEQHFAAHNDDGSCVEDIAEPEIQDEMDEDEMDNTDDEDIDETPKPVPVRIGKVTMLAENLVKSLEVVKDSVASRTTLPICTKVLIEFKEGIAKFTTTNLDTMTITICGCKIEREFSCVLPFKILKDLSGLLYDDIVIIEQGYYEGNVYSSRYGRTNIPIITLTQTNPVSKNKTVTTLFDDDPQDFPPAPKIEGESVVISGLAEAIKIVKDKIVDSNWRRNAYTVSCNAEGLYFDLSKPNIVATDGKRMKIAMLNCEKKDIQFRISKECALILAKFKELDCRIVSNKDTTCFYLGQHVGIGGWHATTTIITQNLQGTYPDYEALKESHKELVSVS